MMRRSRFLVLAGLALAVLVAPVKASDPMGVYCVVEKVVFEPADCPDRAQVWGACAVALPQPGGQFKAPARGYFYYSIPTGKEDTVRAEWADFGTIHPVRDPPESWIGYLVRPTSLTFWTGDPDSVSHRREYRLGPAGWMRTELPG